MKRERTVGLGFDFSQHNFPTRQEHVREFISSVKRTEFPSQFPPTHPAVTSPPPPSQMSGLGGATAGDSRVEQNNALKEWMGENGVWVFDRSDWGVGPHALSVAVRSRHICAEG